MKSWFGLIIWAGVLVLTLAGCAGTRPCPIIPMQLDLALEERDHILAMVEQREAEVRRSSDNLRQTTTRLAQMEEELSELKRVLAEQDEETEGGAR